MIGEQDCTPAVIVINPKAVLPLGLQHGAVTVRPVTVICAERAGFHGVFKLPTRRKEVK